MKLIERKMGVDANTFSPVMVVTLQIPIEPVQDCVMLSEEDRQNYYTKLGARLIALLSDQK